MAALLVAIASVIFVGLREVQAPPIQRETTVQSPGWPTHTAPIRIALLADIHFGNRAMDAVRLGTIIDRIDAAHPDLVVIAGDFVNGYEAADATGSIAALEKPLTRLHARLGIVAVLGNHDHWTSPGAIKAALVRAGVTVLTNQAVRRGPVTILGVDDAFTGHDDVAATMTSATGLGGFPIAVDHTPDLVHKLPDSVPLLLAGHTHCGQFVLPLLGALIEHWPFRPIYDPRYRCGQILDANRIVIVTAGVGSGEQPIRIGAPPDWWLITIGPARRN